MITQETAERIWDCYREIAAGESLLGDMSKEAAKHDDDDCMGPTLSDVFGRKRHLQLSIPSGRNGHLLVKVAPQLGVSVIRAHIASKRAELAEANEQARVELNTPDAATEDTEKK